MIRKFTLVKCSDCSNTWDKRTDTLNDWGGRCKSCAQSLAKLDPEVRLASSERAKINIVARWKDPAFRKKVSDARKALVGELNPSWQGDDVGYHGIHQWIRKVQGKPGNCEHCGSIKNSQWANKSQQYLRDINDWMSLCPSCHKKYDIKNKHIPRRVSGGANKINNANWIIL